MDRRTFGASMLAGLVGFAAVPAVAQRRGRPMNLAMGPAEQRHAIEQLRLGAAALATSRLAQSRANHPLVRQFAQFEIEEQTTLAEIIREMTGLTPPPPAPADRRLLSELERASGTAFDRAYIAGQIDAHRRARDLQDRYLSQGRNTHQRHIAMLARGRILEHTRELELLRDLRS